MKTKLQKRSEALKRREADIARLEAAEKLHGELELIGYDDYVLYGRCAVFVTGAMPSNDDAINQNRSDLLKYDPDYVVLDAPTFFKQKKAAALRDIENLKKKVQNG